MYGQVCAWTFKGLKDLREAISEELLDGLEVYGFIEGGTADDHVATKNQLTIFWSGTIGEGPAEPRVICKV